MNVATTIVSCVLGTLAVDRIVVPFAKTTQLYKRVGMLQAQSEARDQGLPHQQQQQQERQQAEDRENTNDNTDPQEVHLYRNVRVPGRVSNTQIRPYTITDLNVEVPGIDVKCNGLLPIGQYGTDGVHGVTIMPIEDSDDEKCPICYEEYKVNDTVVIFQCGHATHENCLATWWEQRMTCVRCTKEYEWKKSSG